MFSLLEMLSYRCVRHYLSFAIVLGHIYIELNNVAETLTNIICLSGSSWVYIYISLTFSMCFLPYLRNEMTYVA